MNSTQGTTREASTVYGSKDVSHTNIGLINLLENTIIDTNQLRYYSPMLGQKDALYQQQRDYSNLIQKLTDQGYTIPSSSEIKKATGVQAAKTLALSTTSSGKAMIQRALLDYPITDEVVDSMKGKPTSYLEIIKNSLKAGGYYGIEGGSGDNTIDWDQVTQSARNAFNRWQKMDANERPTNWYSLLNNSQKFSPVVYNQMVVYNFDSKRMKNWFNNGI